MTRAVAIGFACSVTAIVAASSGCRSDKDLQPGTPDDAAITQVDASHHDVDSGTEPPPDASITDPDGTPVRLTCTDTFGDALTTSYGRMDGILVSIVDLNGSGCRSDDDHLHLQIKIDGSVYDVALNVASDTLTTTREAVVDPVAWSEGWHPFDGFDYTAVGVHSDDIATSVSVTDLKADLATVNHITIYGTGFDGTGAHLIHRNNGFDGAIVTHPLSAVPHVRMFRFTNQTF